MRLYETREAIEQAMQGMTRKGTLGWESKPNKPTKGTVGTSEGISKQTIRYVTAKNKRTRVCAHHPHRAGRQHVHWWTWMKITYCLSFGISGTMLSDSTAESVSTLLANSVVFSEV